MAGMAALVLAAIALLILRKVRFDSRQSILKAAVHEQVVKEKTNGNYDAKMALTATSQRAERLAHLKKIPLPRDYKLQLARMLAHTNLRK